MKKYSTTSIIINIICIALVACHNYNLLNLYNQASGKTKALFITELVLLDKKIYIGIALTGSLFFILLSFKKGEDKGRRMIATVLFCIATMVLILRPWTYFR